MSKWETVLATDLVDQPVVEVDADMAVEEACDKLLNGGVSCLAVRASAEDAHVVRGLFDFADVNAFLTLAATQHTFSPEYLAGNPVVSRIVSAAKAGKVPVELVSNLSEKNAFETLPHDANLVALLRIFSRGVHRVLIQSKDSAASFTGIVTDGAVLAHIATHAKVTPSLQEFLTHPLGALRLPSLHLYAAVVSVSSSDSVLDAMKLMSEEGVSSVAVMEDNTGALLSAVSVTDVGKVVVPTQSNQILTTPLHQLITKIREPFGSTDGEEHYTVYSVTPDSTLTYTIQKLLATNSHRLFVTDGLNPSSPSALCGLCGVVSIVDILALLARTVNVPGVDPRHAQRRRRQSSTSSSRSEDSSRSSSAAGGPRLRVNSSGLYPPAASAATATAAGAVLGPAVVSPGGISPSASRA